MCGDRRVNRTAIDEFARFGKKAKCTPIDESVPALASVPRWAVEALPVVKLGQCGEPLHGGQASFFCKK
jgi:hypothetical protein